MARYDWEYWRHKYVAGDDDVTLEFLSEQPSAPALHTLKTHSRTENWAQQRRQFRTRTNTKTRELAAISEAEVAATHLKVAGLLRAKALAALERLEAPDLEPKEVRMFLKDAAEIERKALGMDTVQVKIDKRLDELTDEELEHLLREHNLLEETP